MPRTRVTTFEDLHASKKWAFIDGLLTGAFMYALAKWTHESFTSTSEPKKTD